MNCRSSCRFCSAFFTAVAFFGLAFSAHALHAQATYHPDDAKVETIVRPMMKYLETNFEGGSLGRRALLALAIVEATKRYDHTVPKEYPAIVAACQEIRKVLKQDDWSTSDDFNTMYGPCLCMILLCVVDSKEYGEEVKTLLGFIGSRQQEHGPWGYAAERTTGDTSQVQYVSLAAWVANKHGFDSKSKWGIGILDWLARTQRGPNFPSGDGGWGYKDGNTARTTQSISAAGACSVYLISDWFGLSPASPRIRQKQEGDKLPIDVAVFVKKDSKIHPAKRVTIEYDERKLDKMKSRVNAWFGRNFSSKTDWNYYFLYAFERFAYFREAGEGPLAGRMKNWYDQGVEQIIAETRRNKDGSANVPGGPLADADTAVNTAFAVLFLVRSTEILDSLVRSGQLFPGQEFDDGYLTKRGHYWIGEVVARDWEDFIVVIDGLNSKDESDWIKNLRFKPLSGDNESKSKLRARIRGLVTHQKYGPRYAGVKHLASNRDMNNIPALIYALSDPAPDIAQMAHNGLRFISRKIDSISLPPNPNEEDFLKVKNEWEAWYLSVRPDGELLDK